MCKYEGMKDFLGHMEEKVGELQESLEEKDQEINFLRSMLGKLSERLENLEKTAEIKLGQWCIVIMFLLLYYNFLLTLNSKFMEFLRSD